MDKSSSKNISTVLKEIKNAKRPSVLVGNGIRFSDSISLLKKFISKVKIPVLTAWNAHDIIEENLNITLEDQEQLVTGQEILYFKIQIY